MQTPLIQGNWEPRFQPVVDRLAELLAAGEESGAALAVGLEGRLVIDAWCGWSDVARRAAWSAETLVNTFSVSKAVVALCLLVLVDRGHASLDDAVGRYWPEYATLGKEATTLRHVLAHQAGLPAFPNPLPAGAFADWRRLVADLQSAEPEWTPGVAVGEHALTYGHLVGELVRRVDGRALDEFLAEEVSGPWCLDLGLALDRQAQGRCAELEYGSAGWAASVTGPARTARHRALANPPGYLELEVLNSPGWRAASVPAVNIHATATALARCYMGLAAGGELDGVRLLSPGLAAAMATVQVSGFDRVLDRQVSWGLGVQVEPSGEWGMAGIGGCDAFAHAQMGYSFAFVTRLLADHRRSLALSAVLEEVLA